jgi:hypothetical protein
LYLKLPVVDAQTRKLSNMTTFNIKDEDLTGFQGKVAIITGTAS